MRAALPVAILSMAVLAGAPLPGARQTRDAPRPPVVGDGSISGVVEDDAQPPRPVRRAVVTLTGDGLHPHRGAITDGEGRFVLRGLPAGRFTLLAERGGYVTSAYGAKRPGRAGTAITLAAGQHVADLRLRLWRGAAIAGTLRDPFGAPQINTEVAATPAREVQSVGPSLGPNRTVRTNDLGEYRIFGLAPGAYVVRVVVEGFVPAARAASEADIDATFAALAARSRSGTMPATGATPAAQHSVPATGTLVTVAPIYYPGTPIAADAVPIVLQAGEERGGVDFVVSRIRTAAIRGVVAAPDGAPVPRAFVQLSTSGGAVAIPGGAPRPLGTSADDDGAFQFGSVPPGDYRLLVRGAAQAASATPGSFWWADGHLRVTGDDIDLGRLTIEPGLAVSGRVVIDDAATATRPDLSGLRVLLEAESIAIAPAGSRGGGTPGPRFLQPGVVAADGSFTVRDLVPDTYRVSVTGAALAGSTWWLRAALWQDRDLLDQPLQLSRGDEVSGVTLVLSDRRAGLSGTLTTAAGAAYPDVFVLVFPADAALRLPNARRVQAVRPDDRGRFVFTNLPAGDYRLAALTDIDEGQWHEPGFFEPLVGVSVPITLRDGEQRVQDLRVGG